MPAKSKLPKPTGGHTPVSNQPGEAAAAVRKPVSQPPSEGVNPKTTPSKDDGTEAVKDYKRTEAALAELWTPPESAELRDIGEASFGPPPLAAETVHGPDDLVQITNTSVSTHGVPMHRC